MTTLYTQRVVLENTSCAACNIDFAIPSTFLDRRRQDGRNFFCPVGHSLSFDKTEVDALREQLEQAQARRDFWQAEAKREKGNATAAKSEATKQKNRAKNGVCPCCNRSFVQLARHVKTQHPNFQGV